MAFSFVTDTRVRRPHHGRWMVTGRVDNVDSTGSYIAAASLGLTQIEAIVGAQAAEAAVAIEATQNTQTVGTLTADHMGDVALKSASTTTDVYLTVIGR